MLLQSHNGEIHLLPALPDCWKNGEIRGLRARGGFTVDMEWKEGKLTSARIYADKPQKVKVRSHDKVKNIRVQDSVYIGNERSDNLVVESVNK